MHTFQIRRREFRQAHFVLSSLITGLLMCCLGASAQRQPQMRLLVAEGINRSSANDPDISAEVTRAIYMEFTNPQNPGSEKYLVIPRQEVEVARSRMRLNATDTAGKSTGFKPADLWRLADELKADAILTSFSQVSTTKRKRFQVVVYLHFDETFSQEAVIRKIVEKENRSLDKAVKESIGEAIRSSLQQKMVRGRVLEVGDYINLNIGKADDVRVGDDVFVWREENGKMRKIGKYRIIKVLSRSSAADPVITFEAILPNDNCLLLRRWLYHLAY